jgi:ABC-type transport system involved in multi-copper enzyme maturation permease subunit
MSFLPALIQHELELLLRTKRVLIYGAIYLIVALLIGYGTTRALETLEQAAMEEGNLSAVQVRELTSGFAESNRDRLLDLLNLSGDQLSETLITAPLGAGYLLLSLWFLPALILLFSYDAIGVNLARRTFCYSTFRAPRWAHIVAKWASLTIATALVVVVGGGVVIAFASVQLASFGADTALTAWLRCSAVLIVYSSAYVAFGVWCSTLSRSSFRALVIGSLLLLVMEVARWPPFPPSEFTKFASLSYYRPGLWANLTGGLAQALAAYSVFTVGFTALAAATFQRRDI